MIGDEMDTLAARSLLEERISSTQEVTPLRRQGEAVIVAFHRAMKGAVFYDTTNPAFVQLVRECQSAIRASFSDGRLVLKIVRDACFCNNVRVRMTAETFEHHRAFIQEMRQRGVEVLEIEEDVTAAHLAALFTIFLEADEHLSSDFFIIRQQLLHHGITTISVRKLESFEDDISANEYEKLRHRSKGVYFSTIGIIKEMLEQTRAHRTLHVRKAKRLVLNAVDIIMHDESTLLGLANIKSYDDYTFNHSVNVAIYAMALGQRIGLPKKYLCYLGIAGLFHDVGKTAIDKEVLNKPGALSPEEWAMIQLHPLHGTELVLKRKEWGELSSHLMSAIFEHHRKFDLSGYPGASNKVEPSLFSKIITIADCYDALGRPRVYRRVPYLSEQILGYMLARRGTDFDPLLIKVFVNMLGVYPLGSLVLLDTNEIAIVTKIPEDASQVDRPTVCLLKREDGAYRKGEEVNLAATDEHGRFPRTITETLDPNDYKLLIEEFFI